MKAPRTQHVQDLWKAQDNLSPSICLICPLYIEAQPLQWLWGSSSCFCTALQLVLTVAHHLVYFLKLFISLKWQENREGIANKSWKHSNFPGSPQKIRSSKTLEFQEPLSCAKATKINATHFEGEGWIFERSLQNFPIITILNQVHSLACSGDVSRLSRFSKSYMHFKTRHKRC